MSVVRIISSDDIIVRLSDSAIKAWNTCPKMFYYKNIERLVSKERVHVFDVGTIGHVGCGVYLHPANVLHDVQTRYKIARAAMENHYNTKMKSQGVSEEALQEALHYFPVIMRRRLKTNVLSVEHWWEGIVSIPEYPSMRVLYVGKVDAISRLDGALYLEEHKFISASGFGEKKKEEYQRCRQPKGYVFLASENLKLNAPPKGVIHNFFLKKKAPELVQEVTYIGPKDTKRFKRSAVEIGLEVYDAYKNNRWREELNSCRGWKGKCDYHNLCEFEDSQEVRDRLFKTYEPSEKFDTLNAIAERTKVEEVI